MSEPESQSSDGAADGSADSHDGGGPHRVGELQQGQDELFESQLPDMTDVPLRDLRVSGNSALAHALRRLADDLSHADDFVAGFQSAI